MIEPPKDEKGRFTEDVVSQKALATIGTTFNTTSDSCSDTFVTALLAAIESVNNDHFAIKDGGQVVDDDEDNHLHRCV